MGGGGGGGGGGLVARKQYLGGQSGFFSLSPVSAAELGWWAMFLILVSCGVLD